MEIKFFTEEKVLDLSSLKISVNESNSMVSDKMFTKYFFPFEIYIDEEFKTAFGDYDSYDSYNLNKTIEGTLLFVGKIYNAKMEILSIEGNLLTGQIDFGFEDLPNFNKKLSELPLEKFKVADIHTFAAEISKKKYPATNYNFPRMYYGKYTPEDKLWDAYNGYINDLNEAGTAMRNNYVDQNDGEIYNVNIIHPCPHFLYVLKTGFADAGLTLKGEILNDEMLQQIWLFSGTEYFSRLTQRRVGLLISVMDYDGMVQDPSQDYPIGFYMKEFTIPKPGNYKLRAYVRLGTYHSGLHESSIMFYRNGNLFFKREESGNIDFIYTTDITTTIENEKIIVAGVRSYGVGDTEIFAQIDVFSKDNFVNEDPGEDNGVITNLNEIDLTKAVPDITFGEFVNRVRNTLNYDVLKKNNEIWMNKIKEVNPDNIVDFQKFEIKKPKRVILNKRSFLLKSPEWENEEKPDSVFYDESGTHINKNATELTTIIETNTYVLPVSVAKPQGHLTAVIKNYESSLLQLVKYDGRIGLQNNAKSAPELTFPTLFYTNWEAWLRSRLRSVEFNWTFNCDATELEEFNIKNIIGCYKNRHIMKNWVIDYYQNSAKVNITTETLS